MEKKKKCMHITQHFHGSSSIAAFGKVCFMKSISFCVLYNVGYNLSDSTIKFVTYKV